MKIDRVGMQEITTHADDSMGEANALIKSQSEFSGSFFLSQNLNIGQKSDLLSPSYSNDKTIEDVVDEISSADLFGNDNLKYIADTLTDEEYGQIKEEGFSLLKDEPGTVLTEVDKIKLKLAQAGKDVSYFPSDIPLEAIEEVMGSASFARQIEDALNGAGLSASSENVADIKSALSMASQVRQVSDKLTPQAINSLIENEAQPTIENIYKATFASMGDLPSGDIRVDYTLLSGTTAKAQFAGGTYEDKKNITSDDENVKQMLYDAALKSSRYDKEAAVEDATYLFDNDLLVTDENLQMLDKLRQIEIGSNASEIVDRAITSILEGARPGQAYIADGFDLYKRAQDAIDTIENATPEDIVSLESKNVTVTLNALKDMQSNEDDSNNNQNQQQAEYDENDLNMISARRKLEEARLMMSLSANHLLLKNGIQIETLSLTKLVEDLRVAENKLNADVLNASGIEATKENLDAYSNTTQAIENLKSAPFDLLARENITRIPLSQVSDEGIALKARYEEANQKYETLMTAPRADLGDNITKAFANTDEILKDLQLDVNESNIRAVHILARSSSEISISSIEQVKLADAKVQLMFSRMRPATVLDMIREGINPLEMSVDELNQTADDMMQNNENDTGEKFSEYLFKLERRGDISAEERESYIGIYRLLNQIASDEGVLTGQLLAQGADFTLKNYLSASRSDKKQGRMDYTIDDGFEGVNGSLSNSISQQIDAAYQSVRAAQILADDKSGAGQFSSNADDMMNMTPEEIFEKMLQDSNDEESAQNMKELDKQYNAAQLELANECANMEEGVIRLLDRFDYPKNLYTMMAADRLRNQRGSIFSSLFESENLSDIDIEDAKQQILERFGEAIKTPEDMAKAQEALADAAEEAMSSFLEEEGITHLDIRQMKILNEQIKLATKMSYEEHYEIPVLVNSKMAQVSLKIVRGTQEKGKVDIAFSTAEYGKITAQLNASKDGIRGIVASENETSRLWCEQLINDFTDASGDDCDINAVVSNNLDLNKFLDNSGENNLAEKDNELMTSRLYKVAKDFLSSVGRS